MKNFYLQELRRVCDEIKYKEKDQEGLDKVFEAFRQIMRFSITARAEGLFSLEEKLNSINRSIETEDFLCLLVGMVLEGSDPDEIEETAMNRIAVLNLSAYDGFVLLLYFKAILMIQQRVNPDTISNYLFAMCPRSVINAYEEYIRDRGLHKVQNSMLSLIPKEETKGIEDEDVNMMNLLCEDGVELDPEDASIIEHLARALVESSDRSIQRLLRDTDNNELVIAMKGMPGIAKKRIFDNLSERLAVMIAKDIYYLPPLRMEDVEDAGLAILRRFSILSDEGEIDEQIITDRKLKK